MTMKGFPRLLVPRPPPNSKPPAGVRQGEKPLGYVKTPPQEVVMHDCRPMDHVKPPPRNVPPAPGPTVRPVAAPAPPADTHPKPAFLTRAPVYADPPRPVQSEIAAFLTRVETDPVAAETRQTGGIGRVTTPPAPPTVRVQAPSRPQALTPADIPWNW